MTFLEWGNGRPQQNRSVCGLSGSYLDNTKSTAVIRQPRTVSATSHLEGVLFVYGTVGMSVCVCACVCVCERASCVRKMITMSTLQTTQTIANLRV